MAKLDKLAGTVVVARSMTTIKVEIPPDMSYVMFDRIMEERYNDITSVCDLRDAILQKLVDKGGPLEGFVVEVTVA